MQVRAPGFSASAVLSALGVVVRVIAAGLFLGWPAIGLAGGLTDAELRSLYARPIEVPFPSDNKYTAERELLGRALFFDPRLSTSDRLTCASCHNPSFGWGDGQTLSRGEAVLTRRSPTLLNLAWGTSFFWDGRATTLETQAAGPISSPLEMNMPLDELASRINAVPGYRSLFAAAYPGEAITIGSISRALATFERSVVSGQSDFDRWVEGDDRALTAAQRRGLDVFVGPAGCAACHSGWNFSDGGFHDTGLPSSDIGRGEVDHGDVMAQHAFKTPGLRDATRRAPYMHDGSLRTLDEVIRFYESGGVDRPSRSPMIQPFSLSSEQRSDLLAFLETLTAPPQEFATPTLPQ